MRLLLLLALAGLAIPNFGQEPASGGRLERQVADLGDSDFHVRERAHQQLLKAGEKAREVLEEAAENSTDAEVRERASILLRRMGAGERIAGAIERLNAHDWDEVKAAISTLCDEFGEGTGVEAALSRAAEGKDQSARMARLLNQQWKNWERQQQYYARTVSLHNAQVLQSINTNPKQRIRRSAEYMCQREFKKFESKRKKRESQDK